jgi:DNA-directed RNA polymerase specialized sigma24 family protein
VLEQDASNVASAPPRARSESAPRPEAGTAAGTQAANDVEALYVAHRTLLLYVASRKFRIPDSDAENLIQEVFLSYLQTGTKIENIRAWLVAAMCNASRHYWRSHGLAEQFAMKMTVRQALDYLQPRCRETLWLHYFEGRSAGDVARELETTNRYAEKLIHNCLKRVREIYMNITTLNR